MVSKEAWKWWQGINLLGEEEELEEVNLESFRVMNAHAYDCHFLGRKSSGEISINEQIHKQKSRKPKKSNKKIKKRRKIPEQW